MALDTDTVIIGASAAGLASAAQLRRLGLAFEVVEAEDAVAGTWRRHYDRLHLHTPRTSSSLPGLPMPRGWERYPARDRVVEYLERYRQHFDLHPHFGHTVTRVERAGDTWETTTTSRLWRSRNVVVATGRTRIPVSPTWPGSDTFVGTILHSSEFRNGEPWKGRPVLVVGFGNSACELALDLVERGAMTHLSVRSAVNVLPRDLFGVVPVLQLGIVMRGLPTKMADALAWPLIRLTVGDVRAVGLRKLPYGPNTQIARDGHIPLLDIGTMDQIKAGRIVVHGGIDHFTKTGVVFSDGSDLDVDAVVLGTGYRPGLDDFVVGWEAVCDASGVPLHSGAPSGVDGLYFCGMYVSPAGMLREIGIEARRIAADIATRQ
jgi:cation diffusion facilitator CzcD-associated flavoprotein CzcO